MKRPQLELAMAAAAAPASEVYAPTRAGGRRRCPFCTMTVPNRAVRWSPSASVSGDELADHVLDYHQLDLERRFTELYARRDEYIARAREVAAAAAAELAEGSAPIATPAKSKPKMDRIVQSAPAPREKPRKSKPVEARLCKWCECRLPRTKRKHARTCGKACRQALSRAERKKRGAAAEVSCEAMKVRRIVSKSAIARTGLAELADELLSAERVQPPLVPPLRPRRPREVVSTD